MYRMIMSNLERILLVLLLCDSVFANFKTRKEVKCEAFIQSLNHSELMQVDDSGNSLLHQAAANGYQTSVQLLCRQKLDVNQVNAQMQTPLHLAAANGNKHIVDVLIKHGALVDSRDAVGRTPLYLASIEGHLNVIKRLVHHGADLESTRDNGATGFYQASFGGHLSVVEYFVDMSPNIINQIKEGGASGFYIAAFAGHMHILKFLLPKGVDIDQQKATGETALIIAAKKGFTEVVTFLLTNGANINLAKRNGATALYTAAEYGRSEVVKVLLNHKADVNKATNAGETPLYVACVKKYRGIAELLVKHQANPNLAGQDGLVPLHVIAESGDLEMVDLLFSVQASVNVQNEDGQTPLMLAASHGYLDVVKSFIECENSGCPMKPNINAVDNLGESALHLATRQNHKTVIEYLLREGALVTLGPGKSNAFLFAIQHSTIDIIKLFTVTVLTDMCSMTDKVGNTALHLAVAANNAAIFAELIKLNCYNDLPGEFNRTPLFLAAMQGNSVQVKLLLKQSANPDSQTTSGETPLYIAAKEGHISVVEQLLQASANPNHATFIQGATPLFEAAMHGNSDIVDMLLNSGADVNTVTATDNASPLCVATLFGHKKVVDILLQHEVSVNHTDSDGENALFFLAQNDFYSMQKSFLVDVYNINQILERLLANDIDVAQTRHDNLSAYKVARLSGNEVVERRLYKTGYFTEEKEALNTESRKTDSDWDIAASFDTTAVILVVISVILFACMPYLAMKISCILDDKDTGPVKTVEKFREIKRTGHLITETSEKQVSCPNDGQSEMTELPELSERKARKDILLNDVDQSLCNITKTIEVGNEQNIDGSEKQTPDTVTGNVSENNKDFGNAVSNPVTGMLGPDGQFKVNSATQGASVTVTVFVGDKDFIQRPQVAKAEEESFHNSGSDVDIRGHTPYEILCGIRENYNTFVKYLRATDNLAGKLFQELVIMSEELRKIQDRQYDKNKVLLHMLETIPASKWAHEVINHLEDIESPLYDIILQSGAAQNIQDSCPTVEEQE